MVVEVETAEVAVLATMGTERAPANVSIIWMDAHLARHTARARPVKSTWPVNRIYAGLLWCAIVAVQRYAITIENVVTPYCFIAASEDMRVF